MRILFGTACAAPVSEIFGVVFEVFFMRHEFMQIVNETAEVFETADFTAEGNITPNGVQTLTDSPDAFIFSTVLIAVAAVDDIAVVKGRFIFVRFDIDFDGSFFGNVSVVKSEEADSEFFIEEVINAVKCTAGNFTSELK